MLYINKEENPLLRHGLRQRKAGLLRSKCDDWRSRCSIDGIAHSYGLALGEERVDVALATALQPWKMVR